MSPEPTAGHRRGDPRRRPLAPLSGEGYNGRMRHSRAAVAALCSSLLSLAAACGGGSESGAAPAAASRSAGGETVTAAGLAFELPAAWESQPPENPMRLAQAVIPGDGGPGQLAVFHFQGGGGGVDANLERWVNQVEVAPGQAPERAVFEAGDLRVTWVEVAGTLKPSGFGMGPSAPQPDSRLFGAVIEGPGGPWFFKATGPDATLAAQRDAFLGMLESARVP